MVKNNNTKEIENDIEKQAIEERKEDIPFIGRDLKEIYKYLLNCNPGSQLKNYNRLINLISIGINLLPMAINQEEEGNFKYLRKRAKDSLKDESLKPITEKYGYADHGDKRYPCVVLTADDVGDKWQVLEKQLDSGREAFKNEQCSVHIPKLQIVHGMIFHVLTLKKIIRKVNPTLEQMMEETIKTLHREFSETITTKQKEKKDG